MSALSETIELLFDLCNLLKDAVDGFTFNPLPTVPDQTSHDAGSVGANTLSAFGAPAGSGTTSAAHRNREQPSS